MGGAMKMKMKTTRIKKNIPLFLNGDFMNRTDIEVALCHRCAQPIHRHTGGTEWSHDLFVDFLACAGKTLPAPHSSPTFKEGGE
jgi:hypothetical protein